jgi:putative sigma-54 modulation protein
VPFTTARRREREKERAVDITVLGRNVEVPEALRSCAEEKVRRLTRFLEMEQAEVRFSEERNPRIHDREVCELTLHGHGHIVRARAAAADPFAAVEKASDKLEHRIEKLKGKLVGRSHPRRSSSVDALQRGLPADDASDDTDTGSDTTGAGLRIVRSKQFAIKPMTPEEAAMQMELLGHDFFLFTNAETARAAVVYRRMDADIGLIEAT